MNLTSSILILKVVGRWGLMSANGGIKDLGEMKTGIPKFVIVYYKKSKINVPRRGTKGREKIIYLRVKY